MGRVVGVGRVVGREVGRKVGRKVGREVGVGGEIGVGSGDMLERGTGVLTGPTLEYVLGGPGTFMSGGSKVKVWAGVMAGTGAASRAGVWVTSGLLSHAIKAVIVKDNKPTRLISLGLLSIRMHSIKRSSGSF